VNRRALTTLLGGAAAAFSAAWPLAARAQQPMPMVGVLGTGTRESDASRLTAWQRGLREVGFVEGRNVTFEYRFAEDQRDRLPALAADLVRRQVAVIVAIGLTPAALAAKAATSTIPIVFMIGGDPVKFGLVASLNRPGLNLTGVSFLVSMMGPKQFELLQETVPKPAVIGLLVNSDNPNAESDTKDVQAAAEALGRKLVVVKAGNEREIDTAFATLLNGQVGALSVDADQFFLRRREQLIALAARHMLPAIYSAREFPDAGGLMSYGTVRAEVFYQAGVQTARILKGEKPADLPVQQSTKVEFILNLKTAKALGINMPLPLLGRADEVIE
jgi:ABC-type uncharacterized transport system substrate-binding protein